MSLTLVIGLIATACFGLGVLTGQWGLPIGLALIWAALSIFAIVDPRTSGLEGGDYTGTQVILLLTFFVFLPVEASMLLGLWVRRRRERQRARPAPASVAQSSGHEIFEPA